ncbi:uncharacterized protein LOC144871724 [Branchiostoma floridae x Branchiostoma japonicum]
MTYLLKKLLVLLLIILKETGPTTTCSSSCSSSCDCDRRSLSSVPQDLPTSVPSLGSLLLGRNRLSNINPDLFSNLHAVLNLPMLKDLYLRNNQMTTIQPGTFSNLPKLRRVKLRNNPWQCDCRMVAFRRKMTHLFENEIICEEPGNFRGQKLQHIDPEILICVKPKVEVQIGKHSTLLRGKALHLICKVSGIPKPDISVILPSGRNANAVPDGRITVNKNGSIIVRDLTKTDTGLYVCMASNYVGSSFATLSIEIRMPTPAISITSDSLVVTGSTIPPTSLIVAAPSTLSVDGITTISTHGSTVGPVTGAILTSTIPTGSAPSTLPADRQMPSTISSPTRLSRSAVTSPTFSTLPEDPITLRFKRAKYNTLVWGDNLRLVCEASGIPLPNFTVILPSGIKASADESSGRIIVGVNGTTLTFTIIHVTVADAGLYSCIAVSPVGSSSATLTVDIKVQVVIVHEPFTYENNDDETGPGVEDEKHVYYTGYENNDEETVPDVEDEKHVYYTGYANNDEETGPDVEDEKHVYYTGYENNDEETVPDVEDEKHVYYTGYENDEETGPDVEDEKRVYYTGYENNDEETGPDVEYEKRVYYTGYENNDEETGPDVGDEKHVYYTGYEENNISW